MPFDKLVDSVRQGELDAAFNVVSAAYPGLRRLGIQVQQGEGRGFAEVFTPTDPGNPQPGRNVIEVRTGARGQFLRDLLATEAFQLATVRDPGLRQVRSAFARTLTPSDLARAQRQYDEYRTLGVIRGSFEDFLDQSFLDAEMRAVTFPSLVTDEGFNVEQAFSPMQRAMGRMFLQQMQP